MVINDPTGVMERKEWTGYRQSSLLNMKRPLFHDSNGHVRPAMVTAAMLQYCRVLESMARYIINCLDVLDLYCKIVIKRAILLVK